MKFINKLEEWLGGTLLLIIFAILVAQIIARQIFDSPIIWSEELARLLFIYAGLFGISMAIRSQQHVYIDFLTNLMPDYIRRVTNSFVQILIFISIVLFVHLGFKTWIGATFEIVSLGISEKWLYGGLPFISLLMFFRFLQAQQENFHKKLTYLPALFFVVSAVIIFAILFFQPDWFKA